MWVILCLPKGQKVNYSLIAAVYNKIDGIAWIILYRDLVL